jgi:hypothetical protein
MVEIPLRGDAADERHFDVAVVVVVVVVRLDADEAEAERIRRDVADDAIV